MAEKKPIRWRRVITAYVLGGLVCVALYFGAWSYLEQSASGTTGQAATSQLSVASNQHDFGRVRSGTTLNHEFQIENRGSRRLVLNRKACGICGDQSAPRQLIVEPGEQTPLPVTLETRGRKGRIRGVIKYTTSDPGRPRIQFEVTAFAVGGN